MGDRMGDKGKRPQDFDDQRRGRDVRPRYDSGSRHPPEGQERRNNPPYSTTTNTPTSSHRGYVGGYRERRYGPYRDDGDSPYRERPRYGPTNEERVGGGGHSGGGSGGGSIYGRDRESNFGGGRRYPDHGSGGGFEGSGNGGGFRQPQPVIIDYDRPQLKEPRKVASRDVEKVTKGPRPERSLITDIIKTKPANVENKHGRGGTKVQLLTNYYKILKNPTWQLYQYHVEFPSDVEVRGLKNHLIFKQKDHFGGYLFDGATLILTSKLKETEFHSEDKDGKLHRITVKFTRLVSPEQSNFIFNLILRKSMASLKLVLFRRNFFDTVAKETLRHYNFNLLLYPGYITSIRQHEQDVLLCAEITTKVVRDDMVYDILQQCYRNTPNEFQFSFQEQVIGMIVSTEYNNKSYRIDDVDFTKSPTSTFERKNEQISFQEYYQKSHNITIKDKKQPLLISRALDRSLRAGGPQLIILIPELCRLTGLSETMRTNFGLMKEIAKYTKPDPRMRIQKLNAFNNRLRSSAVFNEWNVTLDSNLVTVPGRWLGNETILFGNRQQIDTDHKASWSLQTNEMYVSQHLTNWAIIYPQKFEHNVDNFMKTLHKAARGMTYNIEDPRYISFGNDREYGEKLEQAARRNPKLIMCVVNNQQKDKYCLIKKFCCVDYAIPSQVMVLKTIQKASLTVATKVVIQMNAKLGGVPWMIKIPLHGLMVIGFDICHDSADKGKSYGAMVATMDLKVTQNYFVSVDELKNQYNDQFGMNVLKAITAFRGQHNSFPAKIIVYRDGVGEGQIQSVIEHEVKEIESKLKHVYDDKLFQFGFAVVSKKINTRFFTNERNNTSNPQPGTVVDDVVTLRERFDFFLVSQSVNQGTVSPTNYNIIRNDTTLTPDQWQTLTYRMTHLYYNWTATVRVPAVCHYAHKLAFLVANFLHKSPSEFANKQLYFL